MNDFYFKLKDICLVRKGTSITEKTARSGAVPVVGGGKKPSYFHNQANRQSGVVTVSASGANAGYINFWSEPIFASDCSTIEPKNQSIDPKFLFYSFLEKQKYIYEKLRSGAAQPHVYPKDLKELIIFIPPLEEQKRIAAILDQAEELKQKRQRSLDLLEELKQSIFFDIFVAEERAEWPLKTVSEISVNMRTGPFGSDLLHSEFVSEGIPVLGIDNAVQNKFAWSKYRFITPQKYEKLKRYTVKPKDLLITIMGTVGRCAVVPDDIPLSINTKHLCCISLDQDYALPEFLHSAFLGHPEILRQLGMQTKGAVMPGLNMGIIKGLKIRLPPIELQKHYLERVKQLSSTEANMVESDQKIDELFTSLQHKAFSGELSGAA